MEKVLSARYAKALLDLAIEEGVVDEAAADIKGMSGALRDNPDFRRFLASPLIDMENKLAPVEKLMAGASAIGRKFVLLLVRKGRISIIDEIAYDYGRMAEEVLGRGTARLETASPLNEEQVETIKRQLERITNKKIKVDTVINKGLLSGVRARVGDRIFDGSLLTKIEGMRKVLTN